MIDLLKALTALAFISSLFGEHLAFSSGKSVSSACQEAEAVFRDPEIQWMAVLCILVYLVIFAAMREQRLRRRITPKGGIDHWRVAFLVISTLVYFLNYQRASQSTQTAILLSGALIGSGVGVSLFWREEPGSNKQSLWRFVALMVIMLAIACLWKSGYGSSFSYKKNARWVGPWDNPNLYGLLMASGAALALGLAFSSASAPATMRVKLVSILT